MPLESHFGVPEGWADGGYQKIPSNTMIKVGLVIYCENSVSSCKNKSNEPNISKIALSRDE